MQQIMQQQATLTIGYIVVSRQQECVMWALACPRWS